MPKSPETSRSEKLRRCVGVNRQRAVARVLLAGLLVVVAISIQFVPNAIEGSYQPGIAMEKPNDQANLMLMSMVSCASCHGSDAFLDAEDPADRWKSAWQVWSSRDPHARAYQTLWNKQSLQIVSAVAAGLSGKPSAIRQEPVDKAQYQSIINERCISCHSSVPAEMSNEMIGQQTSGSQKGNPFHNNLFMANGVNCHSCHGATELSDPNGKAWIEAHTKESWNAPGVDKSSQGLQNLSDLNTRAQACVKCHVGSDQRDVNHDLIAAGHPRLQFEFSSHLARLPKHWQEADSLTFYSTCWSIGQTETAKASRSLLNYRAQLAEDGIGPWPEFAEYNCQDCHQGLTGDGHFSTRPAFDDKSGWLTWNSTGLSDVDKSESGSVRQEMEKAKPNAATIIELTNDADRSLADADHLDRLYASIQFQPQRSLDETLHWYLAVQSCVADFFVEPGSRREQVLKLLQEFESEFVRQFGQGEPQQQTENAVENMSKLMSGIRNIVLPVLDSQRNKSP